MEKSRSVCLLYFFCFDSCRVDFLGPSNDCGSHKAMKSNTASEHLIFFACLPVLSQPLAGASGCLAAILIGFGWWLTALFFKLTEKLFPEKLLPLSILLWTVSLAQIVFYLAPLSPFWVLSVLILASDEMQELGFGKLSFSDIGRRGLKFILLFLTLVFFQGVLTTKIYFNALKSPVFSFLILSGLAVLSRQIRALKI